MSESDNLRLAERVASTIQGKLQLNTAEKDAATALAAYYLQLDCDDHPWLNRNMTPHEDAIDRAIVAEIRVGFIGDQAPHRWYEFDPVRLTAADMRHSRRPGPRAGKPKAVR